MHRVLQKIFNSVMVVLLASGVVFALEAEYKNSLEKVELQKTSDSNYNINIYTQKQYLEPVKVIKKSDLNYYILLPETKNVSQGASFNSSDIRNVITKTFPYASQDIENGYTKINISTTKPINFTVNTRTKATLAQNSKTQKKNSETSSTVSKEIQKTKEPTSDIKDKLTLQNKANINLQPKKQNIQETSKLPVVKVQKSQTQLSTQPPAHSQIVETPKQTGGDAKKADLKQKDKKPVEKSVPIAVDKKVKQQEKSLQTKPIKEEQQIQQQETASGVETSSAKSVEEKILEDQKKIIEEQQHQEQSSYEVEPEIDTTYENEELYGVIDTLKYKLSRCAQNLYDSLMVTIVSIVGLIIVTLLFIRKPKNNARLKNKADLRNKLENDSLVAKDTDLDNNNRDKFFIIKDDKEQQTQDKNYELSDFERELEDTASKIEPYNEEALAKKVQNEQDYDTIQKILKEENLQIDANNAQVELEQAQISSENQEANTDNEANDEVNREVEKAIQELEQEELSKPPRLEKPAEAQVEAQIEPAIKETAAPVQQNAQAIDDTRNSNIEPIVLSKVEIAPERGFMCIKFENNISLMGYMFDDVYILHNFKRSKLDDYTINYRPTDKDIEGVNYIVKVSDTKLIVKVTASKMRLEVLM